ncbi:MAG: cob(I)yrinic acid a,c-diamide adenosyltransferase [Marinilabiliales bacterium]
MEKKWKIYTGQGDKGQTSIIGGQKIDKFDPRIEAYGTVDELIAYTGLLRDLIDEKNVINQLIFIQDKLMVCASMLATPSNVNEKNLPHIKDDDVSKIEIDIDAMEEDLEQLKSFILPGGHVVVSHCHILRTICRRAERKIVYLNTITKIDDRLIRFINRLSDYFFVLARMFTKIYNVNEIEWKPDL